jgi:hypothetical protein
MPNKSNNLLDKLMFHTSRPLASRVIGRSRGKAEVWRMLDEMQEKMKNEEPQKIGKLIDEAVKETRKQSSRASVTMQAHR